MIPGIPRGVGAVHSFPFLRIGRFSGPAIPLICRGWIEFSPFFLKNETTTDRLGMACSFPLGLIDTDL